jgi:hypothetical protein
MVLLVGLLLRDVPFPLELLRLPLLNFSNLGQAQCQQSGSGAFPAIWVRRNSSSLDYV